ncbi:MAG: CocE/NonD family hydrolase, partial [Phycisphaerae bacterium]|nr:CocE/NonD family hydrolase [Gemmatimonadaceae bacterium]
MNLAYLLQRLRLTFAVAAVLLAALSGPTRVLDAQSLSATESARVAAFTATDVMIPMRDGVRLHTQIYTPKAQRENLPLILTRTPYGIAGAAGSFVTSYAELAEDGYVFVFQDIRGRFTSEGSFVMLRPPRDRRDARAIDESTDTYDTIEWLL